MPPSTRTFDQQCSKIILPTELEGKLTNEGEI